MFTQTRALAQTTTEAADSVEIGLLTCSPHEEVYSLYGHTAIHYHDLRTGMHWVFNYGVFDFKKPNFVWRFIMGQTDYRLECSSNFIGSSHSFCEYYRKWGSMVEEQVLDLTPVEKGRLRDALYANLMNPVYRYNFLFDNCSTRPRDIIERCLEGRVSYADRPGYTPTFRQMIHECTASHPWTTFGNDLLLGLRADRPTTHGERQFLPANLKYDFDHATVERDGQTRPLVLRHVVHVPQGEQPVEDGFPLSPLACTLLLIIVSAAVLAYELRKGRIQVWWDVVLMLLTGLPGLLLLLMFFSEHPATSSNLQILVLCPLSLLFIPSVARRKPTRWFKLSLILTLAFLAGAFWQDYAEGMEIVALCLLMRYWIHRNDK